MTATEIEIPVEPDVDLSFQAMGTGVRIMVGARTSAGLPTPVEAAEAAQAWVEGFDRALSRFRPDSELSRLNRSRERSFAASPLLRDLVRAALEAAEMSGGLVDPTLVDEIEAAGYARSRGRAAGGLLAEAVRTAPPRRPAQADPRVRWRGFRVDEHLGAVVRQPGLRLDSGGIGKGLAADLLAERLRGYERFLVDCGGDIRVGGPLTRLHPYKVDVIHPMGRFPHRRVRLRSGAVATSGIDGRIWRHGDGHSHHLLNPVTGEPAWTGVVSTTALGPSTVAAETLAKAALLSGPEGARAALGIWGGLFVTDDAAVHTVAPGRTSKAGAGPGPIGVAT